MREQNTLEAINRLTKQEEGKSDSARLRVVLDAIEGAIQSGVSLSSIHEALLGCGFKFSKVGFLKSLQRARKKREGSQAQGNQKSQPPAPSQAQGSQPPARPIPSPVSVPAPSVAKVSTPEDPFILQLREELQVFEESIKHLPDRERRQKLSEFEVRQSERLRKHRAANKNR